MSVGVVIGALAIYFFLFEPILKKFAHGTNQLAVSKARLTTIQLRNARDGDIANVIKTLEFELDNYILQAALYDEVDRGWRGPEEEKLILSVRQYRQQFPSLHWDQNIKQTIESFLNPRQSQ